VDPLIEAHREELLTLARRYGVDRMRVFGSMARGDIDEYTGRDRARFMATEPMMPWRQLAGFRNVIVHGYLGIDMDAVWLVVENDLPPLASAVARMASRCASTG
jgi:hypothetical protein